MPQHRPGAAKGNKFAERTTKNPVIWSLCSSMMSQKIKNIVLKKVVIRPILQDFLWVFLQTCFLWLRRVPAGLLLTAALGLLAVAASLWRGAAGRAASVVSAPGLRSEVLWLPGLAAVPHVGSSRIRDQTHVFCICKWILYH